MKQPHTDAITLPPQIRDQRPKSVPGQGVSLVPGLLKEVARNDSIRSEDAPMQRSPRLQLICHGSGALRLRLGLGPGLAPARALNQLRDLLDSHSFWAQRRSLKELSLMLRHSATSVSAWQGMRLVGFGRATSDRVFRAVLWDVVVASDQQGQGLGRRIVERLIDHPNLQGVERVYLMTSNSTGFYARLGFEAMESQQLMLRRQR